MLLPTSDIEIPIDNLLTSVLRMGFSIYDEDEDYDFVFSHGRNGVECGIIAGFCQEDSIIISVIEVLPKYRRRGVGSKLIRKVVKDFPIKPIKAWCPNMDVYLDFWWKNGFSEYNFMTEAISDLSVESKSAHLILTR
jgi:ribosomal protein S18 acetylase RimI-like enzyme